MKKVYLVIFSFILFLLAGCGTSVKIEFVTNGGTEVPAITEKNDFDPENLPSTTKEGYEFEGWFLDEECTKNIQGNVPEDLKFKLYAKWIPIEFDYKVEYYLEKLDGTYELKETLNLKAPFGEVVNAEVKLYSGFTLNEVKSNKTTLIKATGNDVLKMYYDRNTFKITIDENGGNTVADINLKVGASVVLPTLTRVGYEFKGWENAPTTMPANNITVKALWNALEVNYKIEVYRENADDDGYTLYSEETKKALTDSVVKHDEPMYSTPQEFIINPTHPNSILEATVKGDGSTVLKIYYERAEITVEFNYNTDKPLETKRIKFGASNYLPNPGEKIGHEFTGWQTSTGVAAATVPFTGLNTYEVYATWKKLSYTISFETNANIAVTSITALYDTEISAPTAPVRQGYNFLGWYTDANYTKVYTFTKMEAKNITLYAKWEGLPYIMEFESNGGSAVTSITLPIDSAVTKPIPTREGYDFVNWYTDTALTKVYSDWKMPYNGLKLYAKWDTKTFKITFNTNGGSLLNDISAKYLSIVSPPSVAPTKEGFIFGGYYKDAEFTEVFIFDAMPLNGAVVYVKWVDESIATTIANVIKQDIGSEVVVRGIVYCLLDPIYNGYFIVDSTGQIFIHAPNTEINIGDMVEVTGLLANNVTITSVSSVEVVSIGNDVVDPVYSSVVDLYDLEVTYENYFKYFSTTGILKKNSLNGKYYIHDIDSGMVIDNKSRVYSELSDYENKFVSVSFAYDILNHYLIIVDIEEVEDPAIILQFLREVLYNEYNNDFYKSGASFEIEETDEFGLGTLITYTAIGENANLYDSELKKFKDDVIDKIVTFKVSISLDSEILEFNIDIEVDKEESNLSTVREFYDGELGKDYILEVVIVLANFYRFVAKDDTGYIEIDLNMSDVMVGDVIRLYAYKDYYEGYYYTDFYFIEIVDREVDIELEPTILSPSEFNENLSSLDLGEYVQTTGYLEFEEEMYNTLVFFNCDGVKYSVSLLDYYDNEAIAKYIGYPVQFRFYVSRFIDEVVLLFGGVRGDIQYPDYSDTEAVNAVQTLFTNLYANKNFYPYDKFEILSKDYAYGVDIEYEFSEASKPYYVNGRFINVEEAVPISINFKLSKNDVSLNFTYNTNLLPFEITMISDIIDAEYDDIIYIKGLVVFYNYYYIIVKDDTGYIRFDNYGGKAYLGDYILLRGKKYTSDLEVYLTLTYEETPDVIEIYSRGNEVEIDFTEYSISDVYDLANDVEFMGHFVSITGELKYSSGYYNLTDGINNIRVVGVDGYTGSKLEKYNGSILTLTGYFGYYSSNTWYVYYLGDKLVISELTTEQKLNKIKDYILNSYNNKYVDADSGFSLMTTFNTFGGVVSYSSNSEFVEISNSYVFTEEVEELTKAIIKATITVESTILEVEFEITIVPYGTTVEMPIINIADVYDLDIDDEVRVEGTILVQVSYNGYFYFLIQDVTGVIYFKVPSNIYIYNHQEGRIMDGIGVVKYELGRKYLEGSELVYSGYDTLDVVFEDTTFVEMFNLDRYDQDLIGKPMAITGAFDGSFITNGFDRVLVTYPYVDYYDVIGFVGYNVIVKGFYFGYDVNAIIATTKTTQYYPNLELAEHTDVEKVEIATRELLNRFNQNDNNYEGGSNYYFYPTSLVFNDCTYTYTIVGDSPAYIEDSYLIMVDNQENYSIKISIEIECGEISETVEFTFNVVSFRFNNLEDLFFDESETKVIHLLGKVFMITNNYIYFVIDGKLYYLEEPGYEYYLELGDVVHIIGQKYIIDGVVDYTFSINVDRDYDHEYNYIYPEVITRTVTQIYDDYEEGVNLKQTIHKVSGILNYDDNSGYFFIEDNGLRIYIRENNVYMPTYSKGNIMPMNGYNLGNKIYIDESIDVYLLFPDRYIYGNSLLFDLYMIEMEELTFEEHLEHAMYDIKKKIENMLFYPGDYFYDEFDPKHIHNQQYYLDYKIELKDQNDKEYFNDDLIMVGIVEEETIVTMVVTLKHFYDDSIFREFEVDVKLMPREKSTIYDVLYGTHGDYYMIEGTVQQFYIDNFIILKDETGIIYVYARFDDDFEIAIGDKIVAYGYRDYYDYSNATPMLICYGILKNNGEGDPIDNDPIVIDVDGILDIDYNDPGNTLIYVTFTGKVIFTGNYSYPAHALLEDGQMQDYKVEIEGPTYWEFQEDMKQYQGKTIKVTGWLMLKSTYSKFLWDIYYDYHEVVSDVED